MPTSSDLQKQRWRDYSNQRYASGGDKILAKQHGRGMPCRGCGTPRAVQSKARDRVAALGGPLCHNCRRATVREPREPAFAERICTDCGKPTSRRPNGTGRRCLECSVSRKLASRKIRGNRRRSREVRVDLTIPIVRGMRDAAVKCPLCNIVMTDEAGLPTSKQLDHIVPVFVGGTHTVANTRIICALCNQRRPKDGSDYTGPITDEMRDLDVAELLAAERLAAMPPLEPIPDLPPRLRCSIDGCDNWARDRAHLVCPDCHLDLLVRLREGGSTWGEIAEMTGYRGASGPYNALASAGIDPKSVIRGSVILAGLFGSRGLPRAE